MKNYKRASNKGINNKSQTKQSLTDQQFLRYQRQIALAEIGELGQLKLAHSHVLIIGCGGLGSAAGLYLAAAGIGKLVIADDDTVESSNLQRQVVYRQQDEQSLKVDAMAKQFCELNPELAIRTLDKRLDKEQLQLEVMLADLVLDCTDNLPSRQLINQICLEQKTVLISAAAIGWQGQFAVFDYQAEFGSKACYRCLYPFDELPVEQNCGDKGVIGPVVGTLGNYQAIAAIQKLATGQFYFDSSKLHLFDGLTMQWQIMEITKDVQCQLCCH